MALNTTNYYHGRDGEVLLSGNQLVKVKDWSLEAVTDLIEVTALKDDQPEYFPGRTNVTGSASLFYYRDGAATKKDAIDLLLTILKKSGAPDKLPTSLTLKPYNDSGEQIKLNVFITNAQITCSTNEVTVMSIQFTNSGELDKVPDVTK